MATFQGKPAVVARSAAEVAAKFDDLSAMQSVLDQMPAEERAKVGDVQLTRDDIIINTPQVGKIAMHIVSRSPERIEFAAQGSPVPMTIVAGLRAIDDSHTEITTTIDVEIPAMLKPLIGGALQKAADQFGSLMTRLA